MTVRRETRAHHRGGARTPVSGQPRGTSSESRGTSYEPRGAHETERAEVACSSGVPASSTSALRCSRSEERARPEERTSLARGPATRSKTETRSEERGPIQRPRRETNPLVWPNPRAREPHNRAPEGSRIQDLRVTTRSPKAPRSLRARRLLARRARRLCAWPVLVRTGARRSCLRRALAPRHHQLLPDRPSEERPPLLP